MPPARRIQLAGANGDAGAGCVLGHRVVVGMSMNTLHVVGIECAKPDGDLLFSLTKVDEFSAQLRVKDLVHSPESWRELAGNVYEALAMLNLKKAGEA
jgi:hypothetical protein